MSPNEPVSHGKKKHTLQAAAVDDCPQAFLQGSVVASSQDGRAIVLTGRDSWITNVFAATL